MIDFKYHDWAALPQVVGMIAYRLRVASAAACATLPIVAQRRLLLAAHIRRTYHAATRAALVFEQGGMQP